MKKKRLTDTERSHLRKLIKNTGLTQKEFAKKARVGYRHLVNLLCGHIKQTEEDALKIRETLHEVDGYVFFVCNPKKNKACNKSRCFLKGKECFATTHAKYAIRNAKGEPFPYGKEKK